LPFIFYEYLFIVSSIPKVSLCYLHAVCVSANPPINFWMPEQIFMKIGYVYHDT
jgi:hypothetical protein